MNYDTFVDLVAGRAGVPSEQAVDLTRATLETLADRLTSGEALDLAAQLPRPLQAPLYAREEASDRFDVPEFIRRVAERAGTDAGRARDGMRAVFTTIREAITGGEFDDILSQLPREFADLVEPTSARAGGFRRR